MGQARRRGNSQLFHPFWLQVVRLLSGTVVLLAASGCSELPDNLPSSPGLDATGIWLPFWVVASIFAVAVPMAFYFGLRKISQPFLKFLFLMYLALVASEAGLLWFNGVSITGQVFGEVSWLTRLWPDRTHETTGDVAASGPLTRSANEVGDAHSLAGSADASNGRADMAEEVRPDFAFQLQLGQAGSELMIAAAFFAVVGLLGWRRLHADPETTAATLVRGRLSIGDLHVGVLNAVRGSFLITWAVRVIQPQNVSLAALIDQKDSLYFLPARARHRGSFGDKLASYVRAYARDTRALKDHLSNLATQTESRAQEALSELVREMPVDAKQRYGQAMSSLLVAIDDQIPPTRVACDPEDTGA